MHEEKFEDDMAVRENNNNTIASFGSSAAILSANLSHLAQVAAFQAQPDTIALIQQAAQIAQSPESAITAQILQNFASQNYENNRLAGQTDALNEEQSNEMPLDDQLDTDQELNNEFGMPEHEKSSSQGSPTPSDMSMNRDGIDSANDSEKPYVCSKFNCRKRFSNKFLLKKHEFIHSGLRPHVCPFCNKPFNRKDNLLRHKKTHLNNALSQLSGRRRHNALRGVSEEAADFQLFRQQMNIIEEPQSSVASFSFLDTNLEETN
ncbi:hypothetical protein M3Y97_00816700 [Aphelenchoides bicaudatus]|nr:hypothetical protein M3Y97_00816700 [Aphelenchoides bicaudatus]